MASRYSEYTEIELTEVNALMDASGGEILGATEALTKTIIHGISDANIPQGSQIVTIGNVWFFFFRIFIWFRFHSMIISQMNKDKFLSTLRHAIRYQAKPQSVQCRCADCCSDEVIQALLDAEDFVKL